VQQAGVGRRHAAAVHRRQNSQAGAIPRRARLVIVEGWGFPPTLPPTSTAFHRGLPPPPYPPREGGDARLGDAHPSSTLRRAAANRTTRADRMSTSKGRKP
jgi:hypothetical protein